MTMIRRTSLLTVGVGALAALTLLSVPGSAGAAERARPPATTPTVVVTAPEVVEAAQPLPCLAGGAFTVGLTNTSDTPVYANLDLSVDEPLKLSRRLWSTYLPAHEPDVTVTTDVAVEVPEGTEQGRYLATLTSGRQKQKVWVEVGSVVQPGPSANLALGQQAFASSTHSNVRLCGGVDGNTDSGQWGASGTHDATSGVFPDTYGVTLAEPAVVGRVEVYTLDSTQYPAARMGVRDVDVQVHTAAGWQTVAEVRDNEVGRISARFEPVEADEVQVVTYDSNDHKYSRIVELEVYAS
ncbi:hypothetical protein [Actinopolymorpha pittospori]